MSPSEFEAGAQRWHESDSTLDIWEFLGMEREEYARRVAGKTYESPADHKGQRGKL